MKKELFQEIEIPEGVEAEIRGNTAIIKGKEGESSRSFNIKNLIFEKKGDKIIIGSKKSTKSEKKLMNTAASHLKNMMEGVQKKFEYKLKICFSHFPISVNVEGDTAMIKNFLGEKVGRKVKIPEGVDVKVNKEIITIISSNKESAGQASANFETATKVGMRDRRVFQDGIFIINKAGENIWNF